MSKHVAPKTANERAFEAVSEHLRGLEETIVRHAILGVLPTASESGLWSGYVDAYEVLRHVVAREGR